MSLHHLRPARTALALALLLRAAPTPACPQCAAEPGDRPAAAAPLVALALAPLGLLLAGGLAVARRAHRRAEVE